MGQRLHRAGQLRAAGYTADEVHRMLRSGAVQPLSHAPSLRDDRAGR